MRVVWWRCCWRWWWWVVRIMEEEVSMRNAARLKMGYYPLPESEAVKLRSLLIYSEPASVIDPCVGQGTALHLVTSNAPVRSYGIELDAERARVAGASGIKTVQ